MARRNGKGQDFQAERDILLTFHLVGENKVKHFGFVPVQNSRAFFGLRKAMEDRSAILRVARIAAPPAASSQLGAHHL